MKLELDIWMYLVDYFKWNVMVSVGYLKGDLYFTIKIPIKFELGMCMCLLGFILRELYTLLPKYL